MFCERSTTLSPCSAEIGMKLMSGMSSRAAQSVSSSTIALEDRLVVVDEVHLVHAHDEVRDAQQRGDVGVAPGLPADALARVDEHDRDVGRRGAGDHVARVLLVARRVGDDELAPRGLEVAVGDVDRDPLLALGAQAVGEQGEVDVAVAAALGDLRRRARAGRSGPAWSRRAGGRSASTCRRRPSRRWRCAAARWCGCAWRVPVGGGAGHRPRNSPRACGLPWPPR